MLKFFIYLIATALFLHAQELTFNLPKNNATQYLNAQIIKQLYTYLNIDIKFTHMEHKKSLILSDAGELDGEIGRIKKINKIYTNLVLIPVSINGVEAVAFGKKTSKQLNRWQDLNPFKIGIVEGIKFIQIHTRGMNRVKFYSAKKAFDALEQNMVDIVVVPKRIGRYLIVKENYKDIKRVSGVFQSLKLYHFLHKKNLNLVPTVTKVLKNMKDRGELKYIRTINMTRLLQKN